MQTKILCICFSFCFLSSIVSAQDSLVKSNPKIIVGIKGFYENSGDKTLTPDTRWVYSGGLQMLKPSGSKYFQFETGLYLWTKALAIDYGQLFPVHKYLLFQYLSVPVNCRIITRYFYFSAGPNLDYLISLNKDHWPNYYVSKSDMKSIAIGANANTGFQLTLNRVTTFIEARYAWTLSPIEKNEGFTGQWRFLNIGIAIGLNYSFGLKSRH